LILPATLLYAYSLGPASTGGSLDLATFACANNLLALSIALSALGVLALESFVAGAALLAGLFCYDAFFVFKSDVMLTVATQIEAPAKFLFTAYRDGPPADGISYPFSVLGLGDVVIPGAFVSLMRNFDLDSRASSSSGSGSLFSSWKKKSTLPAKTNTSPPSGGFDGMPYFTSAVGAYAIGLGATFGANYLTKSGQPALVYIVPSLLLTALATAYSKGELAELFTYRSARAAAAARLEEEMRVARRAEAQAARGGD